MEMTKAGRHAENGRGRMGRARRRGVFPGPTPLPQCPTLAQGGWALPARRGLDLGSWRRTVRLWLWPKSAGGGKGDAEPELHAVLGLPGTWGAGDAALSLWDQNPTPQPHVTCVILREGEGYPKLCGRRYDIFNLKNFAF